jgi:hypothetical protein
MISAIPRILVTIGLVASLHPVPALAHASLTVREAPVGATYKAGVNISHGCDGSATRTVRVTIPEGLINVRPMLKPGWTIEMVRGPYAQSHAYFGKQLGEGVKEITWTGTLPDAYFDEFVFTGFLASTLAAGATLYFPTVQECDAGDHKWMEVPAAGQDAQVLKKPAPGVRLLPAADKAAAPSFKIGGLAVDGPWARATPSGAKVAAGYLKITNSGSSPDRLIGGSLAVAGSGEVHEMTTTDGVMKMRKLEGGLEIKPGQTAELAPGGNHMMFTGLREGLKDGQTIKGTLVFEKAGTLDVEFRVAPVGASSGNRPSHHH